MKFDEVYKKFQWHTPYTKEDTLQIYKEGYKQALSDVLKISNGEVINGVLKNVVLYEKIKELYDEL